MTKPLSEDLQSLVLTDDWKSPIPHSSNLKDEIHFKWSLEAAQQLEHVLSMELSILLNQSYPPPCQTWSWRCPLEPPPGMKEKFKDILQSRRIVYSEQRYLSYSLLKSFLQVFPPPVSAGLNCFFSLSFLCQSSTSCSSIFFWICYYEPLYSGTGLEIPQIGGNTSKLKEVFRRFVNFLS